MRERSGREHHRRVNLAGHGAIFGDEVYVDHKLLDVVAVDFQEDLVIRSGEDFYGF
jgi:23S rRNA-/tRNA-specific pseudouridylate synthase